MRCCVGDIFVAVVSLSWGLVPLLTTFLRFVMCFWLLLLPPLLVKRRDSVSSLMRMWCVLLSVSVLRSVLFVSLFGVSLGCMVLSMSVSLLYWFHISILLLLFLAKSSSDILSWLCSGRSHISLTRSFIVLNVL